MSVFLLITVRYELGLVWVNLMQLQLKEDLLAIADNVLAFAQPVWKRLDESVKLGRRILFEGAQGVMLDVDQGTYPL